MPAIDELLAETKPSYSLDDLLLSTEGTASSQAPAFNQVEAEKRAAGIWDSAVKSELPTEIVKEYFTVPESDGLVSRAGKQFANQLILSDIEEGRPTTSIVKGVSAISRIGEELDKSGVPTSDEMKWQDYINPVNYAKAWWAVMKGYYGKPSREERDVLHAALKAKRGSFDFRVAPATTTGEKIVDVGAGLTAFVGRVAIAKKLLPTSMNKYPNMQRALAFEAVNTSGLPGEGVASAAIVGLPGSIPGITKTRALFRLGLQSGLFAGYTKLRGGSNEDVAISALIPVAFATIGAARGKISDYKMVNSWQKQLPFTRDIPMGESMKMAKAVRAMYEIRGRPEFQDAAKLSAKTKLTFAESAKLHKLQIKADKVVNLWDKVHGKNYAKFNKLAAEHFGAHNPEPSAQIGGEVAKAVVEPTKPPVIDLSYKELQVRAKALGIKANQTKAILQQEITKLEPTIPPIVQPAAEVVVEPTPEQIAEKQQAKTKKLTDKVLVELSKAERPRAIIEAEKTKELGKRAVRSAAAAEMATGEARMHAATSQLKGELTEYKNPDFTPLKETMTKKEIDSLHDDIWTRPHSDNHFDRLNTARAWTKVTEGFVPTRGEILLLEKQWGKEFAKGLLKKRPLGDRAWDTAADISNFMRTMIAGGDISVAGRQLRLLEQIYPKEHFISVKKGLGAYASEELSKSMRKDYESSEFHREAKKYVQFFDPAGTVSTPASERPEWYTSHYPEQVPVLGHLIRMGNRNYVETMNHFIQSIWDRLRAQDKVNGIEPTDAQLRIRGNWLMSMSGRPEIGGVVGRRIAPIASGFFFAPRFAVSRFTSPIYLRHLADADPVAREVGKSTAKAFASFIGTNIAILALLKLALGDKVEIELDPRSPDWGKGKIGNTRIDLWAGFQQAARFLVQMTLGQYKTQAGDIKDSGRIETVGRFIRGKENPLVS